MKSTIRSLDNKLSDFQDVLKQYEIATDDRDYLKSKRDFVSGISSNQHKWIEFMDTMKSKIPKEVWINSMSVERNGAFKVEGGAYSYENIANYMYQLTKVPQLSGVQLDSAGSKGASTAQGGGSLQESMAKNFKITAAAQLTPADNAAKPGAGANGAATNIQNGANAVKGTNTAGAE